MRCKFRSRTLICFKANAAIAHVPITLLQPCKQALLLVAVYTCSGPGSAGYSVTTCASGTYAGESVYCDPTPNSNSGYLIIGKVGHQNLPEVSTVVQLSLQGWIHATDH